MQIKLSAPLAANRPTQKHDVQQLKKALNRLGYYMPIAKVGMTSLPDQIMFNALAKFQTDNDLKTTAQIKPRDSTIKSLNEALSQAQDNYYVWHSVQDNKVRTTHATLNGTLRQWSEQPTPISDYNCRCWAEKLSNKAEDRKKAILGNGYADFSLEANPLASDATPWYFDHFKSEVKKYKEYITKESKTQKIDANIISAIIYLETTQGWYDGYLPTNSIKTIRPMNVYADYWKDMGYSHRDLLNPEKNIQAGVKLLKNIIKSSPSKLTVAQIGTLYNNLSADKISDYGARLENIYKNQLWKNNALQPN